VIELTLRQRTILRAGYPLFPLKETTVFRTAYLESSAQDFDFRALPARRNVLLQTSPESTLGPLMRIDRRSNM
jgi:hypothetical protein